MTLTISPNFIHWVRSNVESFKREYGIRTDRQAFAAWVVGYIHELENDDAFNQTDTLSQGDGGLDGWNYNELEELFSLHQVKYPDNPLTTSIGSEPVTEHY